MKLQKLWILLLALCLYGCSSDLSVRESALPVTEQQTEPTMLTETPSALNPQPEPLDTDFVMVKTYIPDIQVELRYATTQNFTGQRIYDFSDAYLRYGTVKKLMLVQEDGTLLEIAYEIQDGMIVFKTNKTGTFVFLP